MDLHFFELIASAKKGRVMFVEWTKLKVDVEYKFAKFELINI